MKFIVAPLLILLSVLSTSACSRKAPEPAPYATGTITLNHDRAPLGSPIELTYKFVVAGDAKFDEDYRVMMHVVDTDEELIWTDDHNPPVPTRQWKPGQTVDYTRTIFVPVYPYVGEATLEIGLYSTSTQKRLPLSGENLGQRAYRAGRIQLQPQTENVPVVFKEGWHPAEVVEHNASVQWQWTKKDAVLMFRNPKKDSLFYFEVDNPGSVLKEPQHVRLTVNGKPLEEIRLEPGVQVLKKIPLTADQLGTGDNAEVHVIVDKTYVPALVPAANSKDPRELGVRVFHAFVDPR
jgi:hypothetical protein